MVVSAKQLTATMKKDNEPFLYHIASDSDTRFYQCVYDSKMETPLLVCVYQLHRFYQLSLLDTFFRGLLF